MLSRAYNVWECMKNEPRDKVAEVIGKAVKLGQWLLL